MFPIHFWGRVYVSAAYAYVLSGNEMKRASVQQSFPPRSKVSNLEAAENMPRSSFTEGDTVKESGVLAGACNFSAKSFREVLDI